MAIDDCADAVEKCLLAEVVGDVVNRDHDREYVRAVILVKRGNETGYYRAGKEKARDFSVPELFCRFSGVAGLLLVVFR